MRRREFITLIGGAAAAWPLGVRAQQKALPLVGFVSGASRGSMTRNIAAFNRGLKEIGYIKGESLLIEYCFAENQFDRLPALVAELVGRPAAVILAHTDVAAFATKAATATLPIVYVGGGDPVRTGLVASLNRPGGNITGVTFFSVDLVPKRFELLRELVPNAATIALLVDQNVADAVSQLDEVKAAARSLGIRLVVLSAGTASDIDTAFTTLVQQQADALIVGSGAFFASRAKQLIALAERHAIPAIYSTYETTVEGGLISYGNSVSEAFRRAGTYTGRILKGEKPADLPVERATKFELVINLKTAKALGLTVPQTLLVAADEVIE